MLAVRRVVGSNSVTWGNGGSVMRRRSSSQVVTDGGGVRNCSRKCTITNIATTNGAPTRFGSLKSKHQHHTSKRFANTTGTRFSSHQTSCRGNVRKTVTRNSRRQKSTISGETTSTGGSSPSSSSSTEMPSRKQLWRVFTHAAVPMIGFGFTDQTVMILVGDAVDCTLGVTFGLSTLAAASIGQIFSDASGVIFGSTLERMATAFGLPAANLTLAQRQLPVVSRTVFAGSLIGIVTGCLLGCINLLFLDTNRSSVLKLQAFNEEQEFDFSIEASNAERTDATALTVQGPDVDGLLASMTAALAVRGASIIEIHAQRAHPSDETDKSINDVFYVVKRETGGAFDDDELEELAEGLLDSTRTPMNVNSVKAAQHELEKTNAYLQARVNKLEKLMYERQITLVSSSGESRRPSSDNQV